MTTSRRHIQEVRIVGGQDVSDPTRFPYFTYIEFVSQRGDYTFSHSCGGTLVHDDVVLTSGHCWGDTVLFARAFVNATDFLNTEYEYPADVLSHVVHSNSSQSKANDIMLLFLRRSFPDIPKVLLESRSSPPPTGTKVTALGFGDLYFGGGFDEQLQEVEMEVSDFDECNEVYGGQLQRYLQVCAAYPGRDTCQGDSGGPLLNLNDAGEDVQVAITSFGYQCAKFPGVYLLVPAKMDWIQEQICLNSRVDGWCPTSVPSSSPSLFPSTETPDSEEPSITISSTPSELPSLLSSWSEEPSFDPSLSETPSLGPSSLSSASMEPSSLSSESMEPSMLPSWLPRVAFAQEQLDALDSSAPTTIFNCSWVMLVLLLRTML